MSGNETLAFGATGAAVVKLQRALNWSRFGLVPDGIFGQATEKAVRRVQEWAGVEPDGVYRPALDEAIDSFAINSRGGSRSLYETYVEDALVLLRRGSRGRNVGLLQERLNLADENINISMDGIFGPETEKAVRSFQASRGLAVDGLAGDDTHEALRTAIDPQYLAYYLGDKADV